MAAGFTVGPALTGWRAIDDARGATVDAEIVGITTSSSPWRFLIFPAVAIAACLVAVWWLRPSRDRG